MNVWARCKGRCREINCGVGGGSSKASNRGARPRIPGGKAT